MVHVIKFMLLIVNMFSAFIFLKERGGVDLLLHRFPSFLCLPCIKYLYILPLCLPNQSCPSLVLMLY